LNLHENSNKTARRANLGTRGPHISLERRASPRLPAADERIWAGWWLDDDEFTTTAARIENISRGGAKVRSIFEPEVSQDVWIRVANPLCDDYVQATVLEVVPTPEGDFWVRMAFSEPCPDALYEIVTQGFAGADPEASHRGD